MLVLTVGGCGSDAVCPNGTAGSPCTYVTEPGSRPEIPSASTPDTRVHDVGTPDGDDGGDDGHESGDAEGTDSAAPDTDSDASAAHRPWVDALTSFAAAEGNEACGRNQHETNDDDGADVAAATQGETAPYGWPTRRGAAGARTHDTETSDDDGRVWVDDAGTVALRACSRRCSPGGRLDRDPA